MAWIILILYILSPFLLLAGVTAFLVGRRYRNRLVAAIAGGAAGSLAFFGSTFAVVLIHSGWPSGTPGSPWWEVIVLFLVGTLIVSPLPLLVGALSVRRTTDVDAPNRTSEVGFGTPHG